MPQKCRVRVLRISQNEIAGLSKVPNAKENASKETQTTPAKVRRHNSRKRTAILQSASGNKNASKEQKTSLAALNLRRCQVKLVATPLLRRENEEQQRKQSLYPTSNSKQIMRKCQVNLMRASICSSPMRVGVSDINQHATDSPPNPQIIRQCKVNLVRIPMHVHAATQLNAKSQTMLQRERLVQRKEAPINLAYNAIKQPLLTRAGRARLLDNAINANDDRTLTNESKNSKRKMGESVTNATVLLSTSELEPFYPVSNFKLCEELQQNENVAKASTTQSVDSENNVLDMCNQVNVIENSLDVDNPKQIQQTAPQCKDKSTFTSNKKQKKFHKASVTVVAGKKPQLRTVKHTARQRGKALQQCKVSSAGGIYEFLSQSQASDSEGKQSSDPAADIIKRMIEEGKVTVATRRKGTGKPIVKRKPKSQIKLAAVKMKNKRQLQQEQNTKSPTKTAIIVKPALLPVHDISDYDDDDSTFPIPLSLPSLANTTTTSAANEDDYEMASTSQAAHARRLNAQHSPSGTFSHLARSVLVHQAEINVAQRKTQNLSEQRRLLEYARKFVSTPVNRKLQPPTPNANDLSQIPLSTSPVKRMRGNTSPWRVGDNSNLPSVFHFSRNTSNLPSFSSDYIPATPRKENKSISMRVANGASFDNLPAPSHAVNFDEQKSTTLTSSASSFSSNDSNAENVPPAPLLETGATSATSTQVADANDGIVNKRQQSNPCRSLTNRSPLKAINILEVVTLPPWKTAEHVNSRKLQTAKSNNEQTVLENVDKIGFGAHSNSNNESNEINDLNLYGFEDFLDKSEISTNDSTTCPSPTNSNHTLHEKLQKLRKWRPNDEELPQPSSKRPTRCALLEQNKDKLLQCNIKEMLCSTMINAVGPSTSNKKQQKNQTTDAGDVAEMLFQDPDPMSTFDEKTPHRTYVKQFKRKRKLRHSFVMFMDSDASSDEEDQQAHELNKSNDNDGAHKKKRHKKAAKEQQVELDVFVNEFNEMCKQVEQYEFIVEKSA